MLKRKKFLERSSQKLCFFVIIGPLRKNEKKSFLCSLDFVFSAKEVTTLFYEIFIMKSLKEKCGLFAVWDVPEAAHRTYLGLFALQHRGQEGAGMVASDHGRFTARRGEGLVAQIFGKADFSEL